MLLAPPHPPAKACDQVMSAADDGSLLSHILGAQPLAGACYVSLC